MAGLRRFVGELLEGCIQFLQVSLVVRIRRCCRIGCETVLLLPASPASFFEPL
jgi:hypothetical protein